MPAKPLYVDVILPLSISGTYTYRVPTGFQASVAKGKRVLVSFGKRKLYSALIQKTHAIKPELYQAKDILDVLDSVPIIPQWHLDFWKWMADYYLSNLGEVMNCALPAGLKLSSETMIVADENYGQNDKDLDDHEYLVCEALHFQHALRIADIQDILQIKSVYPLIRKMLDKKIIFLKESLKAGYKPKKVSFISLSGKYVENTALKNLFDQLEKAPRQLELLLHFIQLNSDEKTVKKASLIKRAGAHYQVLKRMIEKGIFIETESTESRLLRYRGEVSGLHTLSKAQQQALNNLKEQFEKYHTVLLHGVTSSGKTQIYAHLIDDMIQSGKQVLYLLPEIALTTQLIERLSEIFGHRVGVYHSRFSNNERVELWNKVLNHELDIVLGARSAIFLPFVNLGLIVVDEEHDLSFKQFDPSPRYNARDAAVYLAGLLNIKTVLGSATPSAESRHNARTGKYAWVSITERYGKVAMPKIEIVKIRYGQLISKHLAHNIDTVLKQNEQVILFRNRRGFSPMLVCRICGHVPHCNNCDVSLTYHKYFDEMRCHYCGAHSKTMKICPACGSHDIGQQGFGTEKIEDELKILFPDANIGRMDFDSVKGKDGYQKIINKFETGEIQILVGTQMVTKGLDFEKVSLVGILSADKLLSYPDFRASERAFQLMVQVSGRSGRKRKQGQVIIQAIDINHPVLKLVLEGRMQDFYNLEMAERKQYAYPPYVKLIRLTLKHPDAKILYPGAREIHSMLYKKIGKRVYAPASPLIGRIRGQYLQEILIKIEISVSAINLVKSSIRQMLNERSTKPKLRSIRINVDVDPA